MLGCLLIAIGISHAPNLRPEPWLLLPVIGAVAGLGETVRCMLGRRSWNLYYGGILMCLYTDLLVVTLILFFLLYPYFSGFTAAR